MDATHVVTSPSRRRWLACLGTFAAAYALLGSQSRASAQNPPPHSRSGEPGLRDDDAPKLPPASTKTALEANDKNIKKSVEKLFELATELKNEVDKTNSAQVLSLAMVKKAEEIEKLARDIKSRAKG